MEIEKKFLIKSFPEEFVGAGKYEIEQAYISRIPTIRVRKCNDEYFLTIKTKQAQKEEEDVLVNNEIEILIRKEEYESLLRKMEGYLIQKTRYKLPLDRGLIAEIDIFGGRLSGLSFVEVEFSSVEEAKNFKKPTWFGKDISSDKRYINAELSKLERYREEEF